jgi:hypothetical protein
MNELLSPEVWRQAGIKDPADNSTRVSPTGSLSWRPAGVDQWDLADGYEEFLDSG